MDIDSLLKQAGDPNNSALIVTSDWTQGRTLFGGLSASLVYQAIKAQVSSDRCLRSLTTNFVGPLLPDHPFHLEVDVLREGKNVTQVIGRAVQDGQVALVCQACFGVSRESKLVVDTQDEHDMTQPEKANAFPRIPGVTPEFLTHIDLAIEKGSLPFTGQKQSDVHGWMRFAEAPEALTDAHLIALIDAWPPTILQMMKRPAPASTMSWNLEFIHPHKPVQATDWFAYQATTRQAADGYCHAEANIWDTHGELVAISRQIVAVFD